MAQQRENKMRLLAVVYRLPQLLAFLLGMCT